DRGLLHLEHTSADPDLLHCSPGASPHVVRLGFDSHPTRVAEKHENVFHAPDGLRGNTDSARTKSHRSEGPVLRPLRRTRGRGSHPSRRARLPQRSEGRVSRISPRSPAVGKQSARAPAGLLQLRRAVLVARLAGRDLAVLVGREVLLRYLTSF